MRLKYYLKPDFTLVEMHTNNKIEAIRKLSNYSKELFPEIRSDELFKTLREHEREACSCAGNGIGILHAQIEGTAETVVISGRIPEGIDYGAFDGKPVFIIFLILSPKLDVGTHIRIIARLSRFACSPQFAQDLVDCTSAQEFIHRILAEDSAHV